MKYVPRSTTPPSGGPSSGTHFRKVTTLRSQPSSTSSRSASRRSGTSTGRCAPTRASAIGTRSSSGPATKSGWPGLRNTLHREGPTALGRRPSGVLLAYTLNPRGVSSAGRAPALQAGGHRFDPGTLHSEPPANRAVSSPIWETVGGFDPEWTPRAAGEGLTGLLVILSRWATNAPGSRRNTTC